MSSTGAVTSVSPALGNPDTSVCICRNCFVAGSAEGGVGGACDLCVDPDRDGFSNGPQWTAIGCIQAQNPQWFVGQILGWATILGAGIAFIIAAISGIQITLAQGDPKKIAAARDHLVAAISGLLLIIFSIFLVNLLGINILGLGGLGFPAMNP
jgi:hypothetical protein